MRQFGSWIVGFLEEAWAHFESECRGRGLSFQWLEAV